MAAYFDGRARALHARTALGWRGPAVYRAARPAAR